MAGRFATSIDTKTLIEKLQKIDIGGQITYAELSDLIGRSVQDDANYVLASARRAVQREGIVFDTVHGVGLKRMNDIEIVGTGVRVLKHIRRTARRGAERITAIRDYDALPNEKKVEHNTYLSMLGAVAHMTGRSGVKKIEEKVKTTQATLPLAKTLESFK